MRALAVVVLVACGGGPAKPAAPAVTSTAPAPQPDPPCPVVTTFTLADGKLRCRELPFVIDFPAGSQLEREDSQNLTFVRATLDRGVLAVLFEPRPAVADDAAGLRGRLEALAKGIADDAVIADAAAPPQPGATASAAITFTTPDGGAGLVHGYLAHGWFVAAVAGGRKPETAARPDRPMGKAFLGSLKLRTPPTAWTVRDVLDGLKLEMPIAAWEQPVAETGARAARLYVAVGERVWIGAREFEPSPGCGLFDGVTDADVPGLVRKMFGDDELAVTGELVKIGTQAMFAELDTPGGRLAMYLVCSDPRVSLVTVTGKRPPAEIKALLDRTTSPFPRAGSTPRTETPARAPTPP